MVATSLCSRGDFVWLLLLALGALPKAHAVCTVPGNTFGTGENNCGNFDPTTVSIVTDSYNNAANCLYMQLGARSSSLAYNLGVIEYSFNNQDFTPMDQIPLTTGVNGAFNYTAIKSAAVTGIIYVRFTIPAGVNNGTNIATLFVCNNDEQAQTGGVLNNQASLYVSVLRGHTAMAPTTTMSPTLSPTTMAPTLAPTIGGGGAGDPHLIGANGVKYDFSGQSGGIYSFFSSPWYQVTMQLSTRIHRHNHWMTAIGVIFRNESFLFNASAGTDPPLSFEDEIMARLTGVGGAVFAWSSEKAELELCPGHVVTILNMNDYFNVDISVPTCHGSYDGALGQTFQCKYVLDHEPFVWSSAQEESFQISSLFTPTGAFQKMNSTCADPLGNDHKRKTKFGQEQQLISRVSGKMITGDKLRP